MIKNIGEIELDHLTKSFTEYVNHRKTILYQHYYNQASIFICILVRMILNSIWQVGVLEYGKIDLSTVKRFEPTLKDRHASVFIYRSK